MTRQPTLTAPAAVMLAEAGLERAERRASGCSRPVRLRGETVVVDTDTGEVASSYASSQELDGHTYVRCGNRRATACPSCSQEYKGDAWHLLVCGLAGGKGIPAAVANRPCTFVTLTAPSFGPVHGTRKKGPCRARRDEPLCAHGRPLWCNRRHEPGDPQVGMPLCHECYDYTGHVLWQWHAPELLRRFTIALQRRLAHTAGLSVAAFRRRCRIAYSRSWSSRPAGWCTCTSRSGSTEGMAPTDLRPICPSPQPTSRKPSGTPLRRSGST